MQQNQFFVKICDGQFSKTQWNMLIWISPCVSGIFTATVAGTYMFCTYAGPADTNSGYLRMKKNNDVICELWVTLGAGLNIPGCSQVTHLIPGDTVKVTGDDSDVATIRATHMGFSGILIHAD